ncbi:MAG: thermonuclease family protein [Erysipelotrichaceae bacterium]
MKEKRIYKNYKKYKKLRFSRSKLLSVIIILVIAVFITKLEDIEKSKPLNNNVVTLNKCVDGDTAKFNINGKEETVRFLAVDTPETKKPNTEVQPYGPEASEYTCKRLNEAKEIRIEYENSNSVDKYGRKLGWIFIDNSLLQKELVEEGLAKVAYIYDDYKYTDEIKVYEDKAIKANKGIWSK